MGGAGPVAAAGGAATMTRAAVFRRLSHFFIPLAIQGFSMSLTYPLVGSVVSHGAWGATEYSVMAQAQTIMFLVGSVGAGLITTGMIFGGTRRGFRNFRVLSLTLGLAAAALQWLCCTAPFDRLIFNRLYGLDGELLGMARSILFYSIPMNYAFFARNTGLATLFREKRTDKATMATFMRIAITWVGAVAFEKAALVGWKWGLLLSTGTVMLESALVNVIAMPYVRALPEGDGGGDSSCARQYAFTIPLSLGGTMMCIAGVAIPIFLAMLPGAGTARNIHYIVFGILNPLNVAAVKMQSVVVAFPPREQPRGMVAGFGVLAGVSLAAIALLLEIPAVSRWYFGSIQNLGPGEVGLAAQAMLVIAFLPIVSAVKSLGEGEAALMMRPNAILSSQMAFLAALVVVFFLFVKTAALPSHMVSAVTILLSHLGSLAVLRVALFSNRIADRYGVAHTTRHDGKPTV